MAVPSIVAAKMGAARAVAAKAFGGDANAIEFSSVAQIRAINATGPVQGRAAGRIGHRGESIKHDIVHDAEIGEPCPERKAIRAYSHPFAV